MYVDTSIGRNFLNILFDTNLNMKINQHVYYNMCVEIIIPIMHALMIIIIIFGIKIINLIVFVFFFVSILWI